MATEGKGDRAAPVADPLTDPATGSATAPSPRECKFPGCLNPRRPRASQRGAPPGYCALPGHEPDAARRERRRRLRAGLPLDAPLDEQGRVLPVPVAAPSSGHGELDVSMSPARVVEVAVALDEISGGGDAVGEDQGVDAIRRKLPQQRRVGDPSGEAAPSPASSPSSVARAGRLATQLALAAEVCEQLADELAAKEAENAELRRQLDAMQAASGSAQSRDRSDREQT